MNEQKTYDVFAVQNFTHFVIGQRVDCELILDCPYCHRSAVHCAADMIRFIHKIRFVEGNGKNKARS